MSTAQRLPVSLTPLETALAALLQGLDPVAARVIPLADALGCIAAEMPPLAAHPARDLAATDGFALRSRDLVGASSYSPLPLSQSPVWVEAGDPLPDACDCVVDADLVDRAGPMPLVLADAIPGQGVRRIGGDIAQGGRAIAAGQQVRPLDLMVMRAAGLREVNVRRPRLRLINIPAASGDAVTAQLISQSACAAGADVIRAEARGRDVASITEAIETAACDVLITVGGSGVGHTDAAITALAQRGAVLTHGIALEPGRTCAVGRIGRLPVIALSGAPDRALAAWWTLALPARDLLSGRIKRRPVTLPLRRKIASSVGIAEIALLEQAAGAWMPLAVGDIALETMARTDAWLAIPGSSEGFAAGSPVDAYILRD